MRFVDRLDGLNIDTFFSETISLLCISSLKMKTQIIIWWKAVSVDESKINRANL